MPAASRFLTAPQIHDGRSFLPQGSVLEVGQDGTILAIHGKDYQGQAEHFEGVLCPGFVNAHCHLELSHMRGLIPEGTGLIPFLQAVTRQRAGFSDEQKAAARQEAYAALLNNGVVAVGDIANTTDTLELRALGGLHMHTFVECIGFTESGAEARLAYSAGLEREFRRQESDRVMLRQSIVPHAAYSVSPALFRLISAYQPGSIISIHNQESEAEDEYYRHKTGPVCDLLQGFDIDDSFFEPSGKSSLQSYLPLLDDSHPMILVHNTCSSEDDLAFVQHEAYWCLCPGANLYIEGRLPDVPMIADFTQHICIGTDSLASNNQLSPFAELQLLHERFPSLGWESLLRWACYNGAAALGMEELVGSFSPGKKPGVVLISAMGPGGSASRLI